jgi:hypothetical protein
MNHDIPKKRCPVCKEDHPTTMFAPGEDACVKCKRLKKKSHALHPKKNPSANRA